MILIYNPASIQLNMLNISKVSLIKSIICLEFNDYNQFKRNQKTELVSKKDYNYYYKEFERLGKVYEKMAHNHKNNEDYLTSLNLFKLASLFYNESGNLRKKCQIKFYNNEYK